MTATSRAPRRLRVRSRGPPPAPPPIRTGRGSRSAAADERVLADYLETSLRVPDLTLPPRKRFHFPAPPQVPEIPARALLSGDSATALPSVLAMIGAAAEAGAFRVAGAVEIGEVRDAVEASRAVFAAPEEVRAGSSYRVFREKVETVTSKMEDIAKGVIRVLSDNAKNPKDDALSGEAQSVLRLRLHNGNMSEVFVFGGSDPPDSPALSIHLSGRDEQICLRNQGRSSVLSLSAGSMLVTIGKRVQDWSNGEFKSSVGETLFEMTDETAPFISMELLYSPSDQHLSEVGRHTRSISIDRPKVVSFRDQILVALVLLSLFYLFWH